MNYKEKNEVLKLLPWYQLGKLSPEDTRLVEAALAEDSSLAEEFELEKKLAGLVTAQPELLSGSSIDTSDRLEGLLSKLEDNDTSKSAEGSRTHAPTESQGIFAGLRDKVSELLFGSAQDFNYALIAAIIAVNATVLGVFVSFDGKQSFTGASYNDTSLQSEGSSFEYSGPVLVLRTNKPIDVTDQLNLTDISSKLNLDGVLGSGGAKAAILPGDGAVYRIKLSRPVNKDSLEKIVNELKKMPGVNLVAEEFVDS